MSAVLFLLRAEEVILEVMDQSAVANRALEPSNRRRHGNQGRFQLARAILMAGQAGRLKNRAADKRRKRAVNNKAGPGHERILKVIDTAGSRVDAT